ncbi:hypothetical protein HCU40_16605 [Pseudanabaena biceps]|nr:hypothetical protein [Pseudanabaena biceps]
MPYSDAEIENITQQIDASMRSLFIETCRLYQLEREFNYQNYGKYPYRDRKNSVQILADFNVMAYSVNGLFVDEGSYVKVYPPLVIERIEIMLTQIDEIYVTQRDLEGNEDTRLVLYSEIYSPVKITEFVEVEDVEVQTIQYLFPFTASQNGNATVLSL